MEMQLQREIEASADEVWAVIGERFGDLTWTGGVTHSSLDGDLGAGAIRVCHFPPNMFSKTGTIRERLIGFDRTALKLAYEVAEPSGVMKTATNRWSVTRVDPGRCRVAMRATVELRGLAKVFAPLMRPMLRRMGTQALDDLAGHVASLRRAA